MVFPMEAFFRNDDDEVFLRGLETRSDLELFVDECCSSGGGSRGRVSCHRYKWPGFESHRKILVLHLFS